jgi:DNA primase
MSLSPEFLDEVRTRTTLSTLIGRSIAVKKAGREYKACCPFHGEKTPSFTINDEKGFYHCFGCGAHGDAIRWMTDQQGLPFMDAVKELADAAGLEMPARDPRRDEAERMHDTFRAIMEKAQFYYSATLPMPNKITEQARMYLKHRGISESIIEEFGIGLAPHVPRGTGCALAKEIPEATIEQLILLGLAKRHPDRDEVYDFFRNRITIPIHDSRGRVVGFGARILGDGEPKYLNSPATPIFDKGRTLFNLHRAAPIARSSGKLIIAEGYMDVIAFRRADIVNAVAPNGTAMTEHQLALAWKLVDKPTVCMDGDNAGKKAALRAALTAVPLMVPGKSLEFVFPPQGQDPDDIVNAGGPEALHALLEAPTSLPALIWQTSIDKFDVSSSEARAAMKAELLDIVNSAQNDLIRQALKEDFQERYDALIGRNQAEIAPKRRVSGPKSVQIGIQMAILLGFLRFPDQILHLREEICKIQWGTDGFDLLASMMIDLAFQGDVTVDLLRAEMRNRELSDLVFHMKSSVGLNMPFLTGPEEKSRQQLQQIVAATVQAQNGRK